MSTSLTRLDSSGMLFSKGNFENDIACCSAPRNDLIDAIAKRFKNISRSLGPRRERTTKRSSGSMRKRKGDSLTFTCLGLPSDILVPEASKKLPEVTCVEVGKVCEATETVAHKSVIKYGLEKTTVRATGTNPPTNVRSKGPAHEALQSVFESLAPPAIALNVSRGLQGSGIIQQGSRLSHIELTPALQRDLPGNTKQLQSRLLFICACISLARDLQAFEKRHGKQREHRQAEDMGPHERLVPSAVAMQNQALQEFVVSEARSGIDERKVMIALNFGKKIQIIEAISNSLGLGSGLTVLLGYECVSLSQLTYKGIALLRREIGPDLELCGRLEAFSTVVDETWIEFRENYHRDHCRYVDQEDEDCCGSSDNVSIIISAPYRRSIGGQGTCRFLPPLCRRPSQRFSAPIMFLDESQTGFRPNAQIVKQSNIPLDLDQRIEEIPASEPCKKGLEQANRSLKPPPPDLQKSNSMEVRRKEEKRLPKTPINTTDTECSLDSAYVEETQQRLQSSAGPTSQRSLVDMKWTEKIQHRLHDPKPPMRERSSVDTRRLRSTYFWGNAGELGLYTALFEFEEQQSSVPVDSWGSDESYMSMVRAASQIRRNRKLVGRPGSRRRDGRVFLLAPTSSSVKRKRDPSYSWGCNVADQQVVCQKPPSRPPAFPAAQLKCKEASHEANWTDTSSLDSVDDALEELLWSLQSRSRTSIILDAADAYSMKRQRRITRTGGVAQ